jgi:tRNA pseudouridine55 synthase
MKPITLKTRMTKNPINGIFLLDKPEGRTSNSVLQQVKRLFGAQKAGHTGSLDPLATGMLPICLGEATKFCQYLLNADKCYQTQGRLGIQTNSGDATGEVIAEIDASAIKKTDLIRVLPGFNGLIEQIPPMFSALKREGVPLYRLARQGISIERSSRQVTIHELTLLDFQKDWFDLKVVCSKGTYIRTLIEDIGQALGVGAHVVLLRRLYTAGFENYPMVTLEQLETMSLEERYTHLVPMETAVIQFPQIDLTALDGLSLRQGKVLTHTGSPSGLYRLYSTEGEWLGLGLVNEETEVLKAHRLLAYQSH